MFPPVSTYVVPSLVPPYFVRCAHIVERATFPLGFVQGVYHAPSLVGLLGFIGGGCCGETKDVIEGLYEDGCLCLMNFGLCRWSLC